MHQALIFIIFIFSSSMANSAVYVIGEYKKLDSTELYLSLGSSSALEGAFKGALSFEQVISSLFLFDAKKISIRIQGFPVEAINGVKVYYETNMPAELKIARASKGNLNNPLLEPLAKNFKYALQSSSYYNGITSVLENVGYKNCEPGFEKFELYKGDPFVAEISLKCEKKT